MSIKKFERLIEMRLRQSGGQNITEWTPSSKKSKSTYCGTTNFSFVFWINYFFQFFKWICSFFFILTHLLNIKPFFDQGDDILFDDEIDDEEFRRLKATLDE